MLIVISSSVPAYPEEKYDPQNTILALNMAIVSVHRITTTQDRIVLQHEYDNIINKLALGNIESDYEMRGLYSELMNFITGRRLRKDESERLRDKFKRREQKQITEAFSKIKAKGNNLWSVMGNLAVSCVSSYFSYQNSRTELLEGFDNDIWRLKREDIEECNHLQVTLLNASWNLLRQYKLPDEYRLTQDSLNGFYKAMNEADPAKRLRMLRARNVERNFQMYPPYWFYRARAAIELKDDDEAVKCYDKFAEVWRPVLRNDPYKLEEAKYRVQKLALNAEKNRDEIRKWLEVIQDCISAGNWSNNLFAGIAYFLLGDKDEGIACIEVNVDFGYEETVSKTILAEMRKGELDVFTLFALQDDIRNAIANPQTKQAKVKQPEVKQLEPKKQTSGKRRDLTKEEIIAISRKYGLNTDDIENKEETYSYYEGGFLIRRYFSFGRDAMWWFEKNELTSVFGGTRIYTVTYSEFRNEWSNERIQQTFKDFPSQIVEMLIELKALD